MLIIYFGYTFMDDEYLTTKQLAEITHEGQWTWSYRLLEGKGPPAAKIGVQWLVKRSDFESWMEARKNFQPVKRRKRRRAVG